MYASNDTKWSSPAATTTATSGQLYYDVTDVPTGEPNTYVDRYVIYGLLGGLLVTVLFLVAIAGVTYTIKKRLLTARKRSATTGTTRANSWVMLCHEEHRAAASEAGGVFTCQTEPEAPARPVAQGSLPFVLPITRRQGSKRPSLSTFMARASDSDDVGTTPKAGDDRTVPNVVLEEETKF